MDDEIIIQKLSFVKYLIDKGDLESENPEPFSAVALLHYHDALEFLFDIILEDNSFSANQLSFMECFEKINNLLEDKMESKSTFKGSLKKLNDKRVSLKHRGSFPSNNDILESKFTTKSIFEELCKKFYNLNLDNISLIYLIKDDTVKEYLLNIDINENSDKEIIVNLALAFEFLLKDYEMSKTDLFNRSPFNFVGDRSFLSTFSLGIDSSEDIYKFVDKTNESFKILNDNMKLLAFGIDFKKYVKFRYLIPEVIWLMGTKEPRVYFTGNETIDDYEVNFCINFIIECALKLQSFDFDISKN